ncbi:hypothetical protein QUF80_20865 [Desulfococcaceae bacterium HSG8]|nr:hypothetical protein [Desulfococcaceae bacterium HSG8]
MAPVARGGLANPAGSDLSIRTEQKWPCCSRGIGKSPARGFGFVNPNRAKVAPVARGGLANPRPRVRICQSEPSKQSESSKRVLLLAGDWQIPRPRVRICKSEPSKQSEPSKSGPVARGGLANPPPAGSDLSIRTEQKWSCCSRGIGKSPAGSDL